MTNETNPTPSLGGQLAAISAKVAELEKQDRILDTLIGEMISTHRLPHNQGVRIGRKEMIGIVDQWGERHRLAML